MWLLHKTTIYVIITSLTHTVFKGDLYLKMSVLNLAEHFLEEWNLVV